MVQYWNFNYKVSWYGNINWSMASGAVVPQATTRLDILVRTDQLMTIMPNVSVKWRSPIDWIITKAIGEPVSGLVPLERGVFRRVFSRIMGRVN